MSGRINKATRISSQDVKNPDYQGKIAEGARGFGGDIEKLMSEKRHYFSGPKKNHEECDE